MPRKKVNYKPCPRTRVGATKGKKRRISHVVVEATFGQIVKKGEVVHHINGDTSDNRPENLQVMTNSDHIKLHNPKDYSRFGISSCEDRKAWAKCYREEFRIKHGIKPQRIITKKEYQSIKLLLSWGIPQAEIAKKHNVNPSTISRINTNNFRYQKHEKEVQYVTI